MRKIIAIALIATLMSCKDDDTKTTLATFVSHGSIAMVCKDVNGADLLDPKSPNNILSTLKVICVDQNGKELSVGHLNDKWICSHMLSMSEPRKIGTDYQLNITLNGAYAPLSTTIIEWKPGERDVFVATVSDTGSDSRAVNQIKCNDELIWESTNSNELVYTKIMK